MDYYYQTFADDLGRIGAVTQISEVAAARAISGSVTPEADGTEITLPEPIDGALALWVHTDLDQAKAGGTNTIYEALGGMPPGREAVANTIYRSINSSGGLGMGGTAPVADESGRIKISTSKYWRAGLAYEYIIWYLV